MLITAIIFGTPKLFNTKKVSNIILLPCDIYFTYEEVWMGITKEKVSVKVRF